MAIDGADIAGLALEQPWPFVADLSPVSRGFVCGAPGRVEDESGAASIETSATTGSSSSGRKGPAFRLSFHGRERVPFDLKALEDILIDLLAPIIIRRYDGSFSAEQTGTVQHQGEADVNDSDDRHIPTWFCTVTEGGCGCA